MNLAAKENSALLQRRPAKTFYNEQLKIWHGEICENRFGPQDSIGAAVLDAMRKNPENIAQISYPSGKQFTYRELTQLSIQAAKYFEKLQLQQEDVVGICGKYSDYEAAIFFGAMFRGLSFSSVDPTSEKAVIKHVYSMTRPKVLFCDGDSYNRIRETFNECGLTSTAIYTLRDHIEGIPNVLEFFTETCEEQDYRSQPLKNGPQQTAIIQCTSGSTGLPKCVPIPHAAYLERSSFSQTDKILSFSSLYRLTGILVLVLGTMGGCNRIVPENPFTVDDFFDIVKLYKVNFMLSFPAHITLCLASAKLLNCDLKSLQNMVFGGSTVAYSLVEKFQPFAPNCRIITTYGMTEVFGGVTKTLYDLTNTVGKLKPNKDIKIINKNGENLGPNERGEICLRSKVAWTGYLNDVERTKARCDEEGWIHSGDLGYFNDECKLYFVDRLEDILKYRHYNCSPSDIEKIISELPQVAGVCVFGIADKVCGSLPAAAVLKCWGSTIKKIDVHQHVKSRMQDFEYLRGGVYFVESFPLTVSGKILRSAVAKMCEERYVEQQQK